MSQLILEFPLPDGAVKVGAGGMSVDLGNGVKLTTSIPLWVTSVVTAKLRLEMEIEGSPPDADSGKAPVE